MKGVENWTENQLFTAAAPTLVTQGIKTIHGRGVRLFVSAEATRTLTGGVIDFYAWNAETQRWAKNADSSLTIPAAWGARDIVFGDLEVHVGSGRIYAAANGVTASGGTTVDLYLAMETRQ